LAARTNPDEPRHKGISILIVDTKAKGFSSTLIPTCSNPTAATYYDNVEVPRNRLVGELHKGWQLVTAQLNHERLGLGSWSDRVVGIFRKVYLWARSEDEQGRRAVDQPWVRSLLAECYARIEAMRLINFRIAADLDAGRMDVALASTTKVFGTEAVIDILRKLSEVVGANGLVRDGSAAAFLLGELEYDVRACVTLTFGGGTNEIQRELIAQFGLGMPRSRWVVGRKTKRPIIRSAFSITSEAETSALQMLQLVRYPIPLLGVGQGVLLLGDVRPDLCQLGVELDELL